MGKRQMVQVDIIAGTCLKRHNLGFSDNESVCIEYNPCFSIEKNGIFLSMDGSCHCHFSQAACQLRVGL